METQRYDNIVTALSDVATKIQPKPNVVTTSYDGWVNGFLLLRREFTKGIISSVPDHKLMAYSRLTNNSYKLFPEISLRAL